MRVTIATWAVVLCVGSSVGCGDSDGAVPVHQTGAAVPEEDLGPLIAALLCEEIAPCCEAAGVPFDVGACRSSFGSTYALGLASSDRSKYTYDPDAAGACLDAYEAAAPRCDDMNAVMADRTCDSAFQGEVEPGGDCLADIECAAPDGADSQCKTDENDENGFCLVEPTVGEGDPCFWTCTQDGATRTCSGVGSSDGMIERPRCYTNDGLYCGLDGVCHALAALGEPCDGGQACEDGLHCGLLTDTCEPLLGAGASCSFDDCEEGLFCQRGTCAPPLAVGDACTNADRCDGGFCESGTCIEGDDFGSFGIELICLFGGAFAAGP